MRSTSLWSMSAAKKESRTATEVAIEVEGIDTKELMESDPRPEKITDYIIAHYAVKTLQQGVQRHVQHSSSPTFF